MILWLFKLGFIVSTIEGLCSRCDTPLLQSIYLVCYLPLLVAICLFLEFWILFGAWKPDRGMVIWNSVVGMVICSIFTTFEEFVFTSKQYIVSTNSDADTVIYSVAIVFLKCLKIVVFLNFRKVPLENWNYHRRYYRIESRPSRFHLTFSCDKKKIFFRPKTKPGPAQPDGRRRRHRRRACEVYGISKRSSVHKSGYPNGTPL